MRTDCLTSLLLGCVLWMTCIGMVSGADREKITITYNGNTAKVSKVKDKDISVTCNGAKVVVESQVTGKEIEYVLKGSSSNGSFELNGKYKATVTLDGLNLKTDEGAAINLKCGKRMKLHINKGTENTLEDGTDTLHKACVYTKGHLEIGGGGKLTLTGHAKNVISAKEYLQVKASTGDIVIRSSTGSALNTDSYMLIDGGNIDINLSSVDKRALKSDSTMTINGGTIKIVMTGNGGKGIKCDGDLVINGGTLDIKTTGSYVSERPFGFGGFPGFSDGEMPDFGGFPFGEMSDSTGFRGFPFGEMPEGGFPDFGGFPFGERSDSAGFRGFPRFGERPDSAGFRGFPRFGEMSDSAGFRGFPRFGERPDSADFGGFGGFPFGEMPEGGFPDFGGFPGFGGFGGGGERIQVSDSVLNILFGDEKEERHGGFAKRKYDGSAKGIRVAGKVTVNGGDIRIETSSDGAEGLEGKQGITINGGKIYVKAQDDGLNSSQPIIFNDGDVFVWSVGNDAIDSNYPRQGGIVIHGGKVVACSQVGSPEEAFDCDFTPMEITGGTVFGMGGAMGGGGTTPLVDEKTQCTASLNGLPCPVGKTIVCVDSKGKELFSFVIPFSMRSSNSVLSLPQFTKGQTYSVKIKEPDILIKDFTFDDVIAK